MYKLAF